MPASTLVRCPSSTSYAGLSRSGAAPFGEVELHAARYGGVGVLRLDERTINLTPIQLALVEALLERWRGDDGASALVGGFMPSWELLDRLPWDTMAPDDANLKAVVRRLRGKLADWPLGIESRRGFGYRLAFETGRAERAASSDVTGTVGSPA